MILTGNPLLHVCQTAVLVDAHNSCALAPLESIQCSRGACTREEVYDVVIITVGVMPPQCRLVLAPPNSLERWLLVLLSEQLLIST